MFYPESTQELCRIVRDAGEKGVPLVARSSGAPHFHGASVCDGAETVCFSKMDRIIRLDRKSRYVRVEPGVTFGALIPKLAENGMRLNLPFLGRANKSVVASALEKEAVTIPKYQYDYTDPLLTVETVFGTGDVFRTGSAAGPGTPEENRADMVIPWGPGTIDYLRFLCGAQGTLGLVTWGTLKTEVLPRVSALFFVEAQSAEPLLDLANRLLLRRIPDECVLLDRENFASAFSDGEAEKEALSRVAPWLLLCRICGFERYPEERFDIYRGYLEDAAAELGLTVRASLGLTPGLEEKLEKRLTDCDRRESSWKLRKGAFRDLLVTAPPSRTGAVLDILKRSFPDAGFTVLPQVLGRAYRIECDLFLENEPAVLEKADEAIFRVWRELLAAGAVAERPYGRLRELVYTDPVATDAMQRLKRIFDPDKVLNPGKLCF
jgi:FAD/FMN-containing dehydrogenase